MNWDKILNKNDTEIDIHKNILQSKEVLADAMDDNSSEPPDNIDSPDGEKSQDFDNLDDESSDGTDSDGGDSSSDDSGGTDYSSDFDSETSSDSGMEEEEEDSKSGIRNNPLDTYHSRVKLMEEFTNLENTTEKIINKLSEDPRVDKKIIKPLEDILDTIQKDKMSVSISTISESILQFQISSRLLKETLKRIADKIKFLKKKSKDRK